eukprot:scaffold143072_cov17-Tisochrysis_lutea.AAC.1
MSTRCMSHHPQGPCLIIHGVHVTSSMRCIPTMGFLGGCLRTGGACWGGGWDCSVLGPAAAAPTVVGAAAPAVGAAGAAVRCCAHAAPVHDMHSKDCGSLWKEAHAYPFLTGLRLSASPSPNLAERVCLVSKYHQRLVGY